MLKVVILCGGRGHRLRPLTSNLPKPLVALNGKPILQHIIEFYTGKGLNRFILCTGYRANVINEFFSTHKFNVEIEVSNAGTKAGMLKRLYLARDLIGEKAVVTYGDTFVNIDVCRMLKEHNRRKAAATITVADIRSPFGLVQFDRNNKVDSFEEKPLFQYYIGHMILEKSVLDNLDAGLISMPDGEGLIKLFQRLIKSKKLYVYKHAGLQITFNTLYERQKAEEEFTKFFTEQEG
ncbi:MAG: nucleotidyltransferase family protein [Candidatus Omnitrophota bacterium]